MNALQAVMIGGLLAIVAGGLGWFGLLSDRKMRAGYTLAVFFFVSDLSGVTLTIATGIILLALGFLVDWVIGVMVNELQSVKAAQWTVTGGLHEPETEAYDPLADLFDVQEVTA